MKKVNLNKLVFCPLEINKKVSIQDGRLAEHAMAYLGGRLNLTPGLTSAPGTSIGVLTIACIQARLLA